MKFKKEGTFTWRFGFFLITLGVVTMFTKDEIVEVRKLLEEIKKRFEKNEQ